MQLTHMDWVRAALANARAEGLDLDDLCAMAEHATSAEAFDDAVNELASASSTYDAYLLDALAMMYPK